MSDHEHNADTLLPMYRSDLCGEGCVGRWYSHCLPHGWWCPTCGADTPDPEAPQVGSLPRWAVHVLPDFKVRITAPDPLEGHEFAKFEASVMAAGREAKERKAKAIAVGLGHVGWRITEENVVWFWTGAHRREHTRAATTAAHPAPKVAPRARCPRPRGTPAGPTHRAPRPRSCARPRPRGTGSSAAPRGPGRRVQCGRAPGRGRRAPGVAWGTEMPVVGQTAAVRADTPAALERAPQVQEGPHGEQQQLVGPGDQRVDLPHEGRH